MFWVILVLFFATLIFLLRAVFQLQDYQSVLAEYRDVASTREIQLGDLFEIQGKVISSIIASGFCCLTLFALIIVAYIAVS